MASDEARVEVTGRSRWLVLAAGILLAVGIPWALLGIMGLAVGIAESAKTCDPTLPVCRNFAYFGWIIAAVGLLIGGLHFTAGIKNLRSGRAGSLAWTVATIGALVALYMAFKSINPSYFNEVDGAPVYDTNARLVALTFIPYVAALGLMFVDRRRQPAMAAGPH